MIHILEAGKVAEDGDDGKKLRDDGTEGEEDGGRSVGGWGKVKQGGRRYRTYKQLPTAKMMKE